MNYTYKVTTSAGVPLVAKPHPFFPMPGPQTVFCYVLGTFDASIVGFLVSRLF